MARGDRALYLSYYRRTTNLSPHRIGRNWQALDGYEKATIANELRDLRAQAQPQRGGAAHAQPPPSAPIQQQQQAGLPQPHATTIQQSQPTAQDHPATLDQPAAPDQPTAQDQPAAQDLAAIHDWHGQNEQDQAEEDGDKSLCSVDLHPSAQTTCPDDTRGSSHDIRSHREQHRRRHLLSARHQLLRGIWIGGWPLGGGRSVLALWICLNSGARVTDRVIIKDSYFHSSD